MEVIFGGEAAIASAAIDFAGKNGADFLGSTLTIGDKSYDFAAAVAQQAVVNTAADTAATIRGICDMAVGTTGPAGFT